MPSLDSIDSNGYGELIQVCFGFGVVKVKVFQRVISGPRALQMKLLSGSTSREFVSTSIHVYQKRMCMKDSFSSDAPYSFLPVKSLRVRSAYPLT